MDAGALGRYFFLGTADVVQIRKCRGSHNRLGFALQLVLLRFLHVVVPTFDRVPDAIIHFVSLQLDINFFRQVLYHCCVARIP